MSDSGICIIGGGIGGVAAAVALARSGIHAEVFERAPRLTEVGSGLSLWPNATRALRELGLLEDVVVRSGVSTKFLVRRNDGRVLMDLNIGATDVPALCTHRADLLDILMTRLKSTATPVHLDHELEQLDMTGSKPVVTFRNGVRREFDAVIGADGIRSRVRAKLFGNTDPTFRGYMICRGVGFYEGPNMPAFTHSESWGAGRRFGILTMAGKDTPGRFTWYGTANDRRDANGNTIGTASWSRDADTRKRELLEAFADWHEPIPQLIASTPAETIHLHGAYDRPSLKHWSRGAVTLLGDAAHPLTPNLGQGGCLAIEDAVVLAKCVVGASSMPHAFRQYEELRMSRTRHLTERSALLGWIGQWENRGMVAVRQAVTGMLPARIFENNLRRVYSYQV